MANSKRVDLLLLGKPGQGRSSTGNSILGREAFEVSGSSGWETYEAQVSFSHRLNRIIKVVDGPGFFSGSRLDRGAAAEKLTEDMAQSVLYCPEGFHALLLVFQYGARYTAEDVQTVEMLKSIFGESFVRDFCILVFTHGENFDLNNSHSPEKTFSHWCKEQKGTLKSLLSECDYRAVLFYNKSPDKSDSQVEELLSMVDSLQNVRYTNEIFQRSAEAREQLIVREKAPQLRQNFQVRIELLTDGLTMLRIESELNNEVVRLVKQLRRDARKLEIDIVLADRGTGVLNSQRQVVANLLENIDSQEEVLRERQSKAYLEQLSAAQEVFNRRLELQKQQAKEQQNSYWGCSIV